ncbi:MAG: glutamate--cysteine ligase [Roseiarcus sp.]
MARDVIDSHLVESERDLIAWFEAGAKSPGMVRIGTEHEKLTFYEAEASPVPYEGERGVGALLAGMREALGWEPIEDGGRLIGLYDPAHGGAISLEPGGQFELSGAPVDSVHETADELDRHLAVAKAAAAPLGIGFLALGMSPKWRLAETPAMPKSRYRIMTAYMPKVGTRGLDMMYRTCTVQSNLDFCSEADMVTKLRVGLALQPMITALFANSPFTDGKANGFVSARSDVWLHTDDARTGMLPFAFEPGMGFERYVDYALDVPMYFVKRGDIYHDVSGASFRDLLDGRLAGLPGERATLSDWANHLSTIFPEVRLKRYLEMRGADVGPRDRIVALPALMVGLYYDADALAGARDLTAGWDEAARLALRVDAPRLGLAAPIAGRTLRDVARDALALARAGLERRARRNDAAEDETKYLAPLEKIVDDGRSPAELWLARYEREWRHSVEPIFAEAGI